MNRLAAAGCIAVCLAFSVALSAQTPVITLSPTGTAGTYTLTSRYYAGRAQAHTPASNVAFEDTTYSNAVIASAPFSSLSSNVAWGTSPSLIGATGNYSNILARDFDSDGKPDLLFVDSDYADNGGYSLVFCKGNGDGTFHTCVVDRSANMQTTFLTAGDWDGDGKLDIAASGTYVSSGSGPTTANIQIRRGNGDGTFQPTVLLTESVSQFDQQGSLQSGDFNGDGKLDLFSSGNIAGHLHLGNGDGTFAAAVNTDPAIGPAADFNNDGRTDVIAALYTLLGSSSGTFQRVNNSGLGTTDVAVGDFNGDGKLDIANTSASVALGNGDGTFQAATSYDVTPDPSYFQWGYYSITSGDFNGDGISDISLAGYFYASREQAISGSASGVMTTLFGLAGGGFSPKSVVSAPVTPFGVSTLPVVSIDSNSDGVSEPFVFYPSVGSSPMGASGYIVNNVFIATATNVIVSPGGTHQVRAHYPGDSNYGVAISATQALTGSAAQATLSLTVSPNPSTYMSLVSIAVTITPCTVGSYSCDSDFVTIYDGSTAITSVYPSGGVAHVSWRNFSQGTHVLTAKIAGNTNLSSATSNAVTLTVGPPAGIIGTLTLNTPQGSDSVYTLTAQFSSPVLTTAPTGSVSFLDVTANNNVLGTATFGSPAPTLKANQALTSEDHVANSLYAADFDNDGKSDLIYPGENSVVFLRGNGDGTFSGTASADGGGYAAVADFNNDGKLDVMLPQSPSSGMLLLRGNGDGTFTSGTSFTDGALSAVPLAGDFNGDGKQDVYNFTTKNVFFGNGDGTFQSATATTIAAQLAADFNQDGRTDLFTTGGVYLGQTNKTFVSVPAPSAYSKGVLVADFNKDGKPDVFTADNTLLLGNGDGSFQTARAVDLATGTSGTPYDIKYFTGDFNGDGKADVGLVAAYPNIDADGTYIYIMVAAFGDGTGAFANKNTYTSGEFLNILNAIPSYLPDFNGDAASDIPVFGQTSPGYNWISLFTTPTVYPATATGVTVLGPPPGDHSIQATYPGDVNYLDATSNTVTVAAQTPVTLTFAVTPNPATAGQPVTFTGTLSPFSDINDSTNGEPIVFREGTNFVGSGNLDNGVAQFTTSSLSAGTHNITAEFTGDHEFARATSAPISVQINYLPVTITWSTPAAITYGTALSSAQLNASTTVAGSFGYSPAAGTVLNAGTQTLSTTFTPNNTATYNTTTATTTLVVNKATPGIAVTQTSPTTTGTNVGQSATLRATITASHGTPAGTVTFYDGAASIGVGTLSGNAASIATTFTTAGTHVITAAYSGDANFNTVTSSGFNEIVSKLTPSITWPAPATIIYGTALSTTQLNATSAVAGTFAYSPTAGTVLGTGLQMLSVTFTPTDTATYNNATATTTLVVNKATPLATVTQASSTTPNLGASVTLQATITAGYGTPTGTVTFYDGTASIGTGTLAGGSATLTTSFSTAGTHLITAIYTGDTNFNPATSSPLSETVVKVTPSITWAAPSAITYGTALSASQLNATSAVAGAFAYSPAAGTVLGAGLQTLSTTFTPTDTANYNNASGTTTLIVNKATPSITIAQTSPITIGVGTGVATTFRANMAAPYGTPSGTVGFYEGTSLLGTGTLINGATSVTTTFSSTGVHTITALYTGDANFNSVTSAAFNETVVLFGIGFAANPTTLTIKQGQSGTATITAAPTGNYTGTLTFSCGNLPSSVSCSFAPATLTFNGDNQPQSTTITVSTRTSSAALMTRSSLRLASLFAMPLLAFGLRRRRMLQRGLLVLFAAMLLLPVSGCGGSPTTTSSAPAGQQTVTINAQTTANGGSTQSFNFSIVIEP